MVWPSEIAPLVAIALQLECALQVPGKCVHTHTDGPHSRVTVQQVGNKAGSVIRHAPGDASVTDSRATL